MSAQRPKTTTRRNARRERSAPGWRAVRVLRPLLAALLLVAVLGPARASHEPIVRFGLTAVVSAKNLRFFDRLGRYLDSKIKWPVEFVRTRSYQEVMERLRAEELEFAWICGYPFVQRREPEFISLLAVPIFRGAPRYRSYTIVHQDSRFRDLNALQDQVFAYSDPNSNSGYLYPRFALVERGYRPERFFRRTFFTYNHAETVQAVAERVADGGAVESYIWEMLSRAAPEMTARTRVIERSPSFAFPPIVSHVAVSPLLRERMRSALMGMGQDEEGRALLAELALDGFGEYPPALFDDIRAMARRVDEARRPGRGDGVPGAGE